MCYLAIFNAVMDQSKKFVLLTRYICTQSDGHQTIKFLTEKQHKVVAKMLNITRQGVERCFNAAYTTALHLMVRAKQGSN